MKMIPVMAKAMRAQAHAGNSEIMVKNQLINRSFW